MILGCTGAGKSTLARAVGERTGLPVVHLDLLFWEPGWVEAPQERARRELAAAAARPRWIIEGNFLPAGGEPDPRFARADAVVFLDVARLRCLWRVLTRLVRDRGRRRPDLPDGCREGPDIRLLRWLWGYRRTSRPLVLALLAGLPGDVAVCQLRSRADVRAFLAGLPVPASTGAAP